MKGPETEEPVLSQEELAALLERLSERDTGASWAGLGRKEAASEARIVSLSLQRASEIFCERISRNLSNVFQSPIHFSLIDWRDSEPEEFEQLMVPNDHAVVFDLVPGAGHGIMLIGRTLLFQFLSINLGASPGLAKSSLPIRPYTSIERRFYRRFAQDLLVQLGEAWSEETKISPKITALIERKHVKEEAAEGLYLATFDVAGFGEVCRLRVAVPSAAFEDRVAAVREVASLSGTRVEETVLDMELDFRVQIGSVEMSLRDFSNLSVDDVIPIDRVERGELLVSVAGVSKFNAIRGAVGRQLAVQLVDRF